MYLPPYFFLPQHVIFSKIIVLWQVCHNTLLFESQHIIFSKDIVLCTMSATQYFWKKYCFVTQKVMCCGKFVTTH